MDVVCQWVVGDSGNVQFELHNPATLPATLTATPGMHTCARMASLGLSLGELGPLGTHKGIAKAR